MVITIAKKIANAATTEFRMIGITTDIFGVMPAATTLLVLTATH
jgi:hypothetical protein